MRSWNIDSLYVPRVQDSDISSFIERPDVHKPVLLVEGARQVGKTRLVSEALKNKPRSVVLNLERDALARSSIDACRQFSDFEELLEDEYGYTGRDGRVLFFDEAQESIRLGGFVRFMREEWSRATVLLSGSTLTRLFRDDTRYPVGRVERLIVRPFSFSEFLTAIDKPHLANLLLEGDLKNISVERHRRLLDLYDKYLQVGGLPEVVRTFVQGGNFQRVQARIAADYQQDFIRIFGEDKLSMVQASLRAIANYVGSPFKNTKVVPGPTTRVNERINTILARLESWHMVLRSDQVGPSTSGSQRRLPKRYLFDTGLMRHLREAAVPAIHILESTPSLRTILGGTLENQLAIDLVRHQEPLVGWKQSSGGNEIDFIHRLDEERTVPVECKATLVSDRRHLKGLRVYLAQYPTDIGVLVSFAPYAVEELTHGGRVIWLPAYASERLAALTSSEFHEQRSATPSATPSSFETRLFSKNLERARLSNKTRS